MRERGRDRARWMGEWDEGERRVQVSMDAGVGYGREEGAGLDGCGSGMRERGGERSGWMGEWDEGEMRGHGWLDAGVG